MADLTGVFAAAVTPLRADLTPDLDALPSLLGFLAGRGCHGALILGTTGEGPSFAPEERAAIFRAAARVRETFPDFKLLAGTGTPSLPETESATRTAFDLGFDGAVVLPPYYFKKVGEDGLLDYFSRLMRSSVPADGALFYYHFPALTGINIAFSLLERLREAFPGRFAGIKDSSGDEAHTVRLAQHFGRDFRVMAGGESAFLSSLQAGGSGCITAPANLLSPGLRAVWDAFARGEDAAAMQAQLSARRAVLERYTPFPIVLKALLARQHNFPLWPVRPPLMNLPGEQADRAAQELEEIK
jgi:4-hydroxy-tetrahydrodipicolinate synthase